MLGETGKNSTRGEGTTNANIQITTSTSTEETSEVDSDYENTDYDGATTENVMTTDSGNIGVGECERRRARAPMPLRPPTEPPGQRSPAHVPACARLAADLLLCPCWFLGSWGFPRTPEHERLVIAGSRDGGRTIRHRNSGVEAGLRADRRACRAQDYQAFAR